MSGPRAEPIVLSEPQRTELERLIAAHSTPQQLVVRCRIILLYAQGLNLSQVAEELAIWRKTVRHWVRRWLSSQDDSPIAERLADAERSGGPGTFSPEQIVAIIAIGCELVEGEDGCSGTRTQQEVATEAIKREIVPSISPHSVGRFFKRCRPQAA